MWNIFKTRPSKPIGRIEDETWIIPAMVADRGAVPKTEERRVQAREHALYESAMSGKPLIDIGQISPRIKRTLNSDVRCGNLKKFRAPWAFVVGHGFIASEKQYYCLMRGSAGRDWTRRMLLAYIQEQGEEQGRMLAEKGIVL